MKISQTYMDGLKSIIELEKCLDILEKNGYDRNDVTHALSIGLSFKTYEAEYRKV